MRNRLGFIRLGVAAICLTALLNGGAAGQRDLDDHDKDKGFSPTNSVEVRAKAARDTFYQLEPVEVVVRSENVSKETFLVDANGSLGHVPYATARYLIEVTYLGSPEGRYSPSPKPEPDEFDRRALEKNVDRTRFAYQARSPERSYFQSRPKADGQRYDRSVRPLAPSESQTDTLFVNLLYDMTRVGHYEIRVGLPVRDKSGHRNWVDWSDPIRLKVVYFIPNK